MYITSFGHREEFFNIVQRWFSNRLNPSDGTRITKILICDGFILGETLDAVTTLLLEHFSSSAFQRQPLRFKGELRDIITRNLRSPTPRLKTLAEGYVRNPEFFYKEAPINGTAYLDGSGTLVASCRIKRPRRIAEKAQRYIADHIFRMVQDRARRMAEDRALGIGVPLEGLLTPPEEMVREFALAERAIADAFMKGEAKFDRSAVTIHDVGGLKFVAPVETLRRVEEFLLSRSDMRILERQKHGGVYRAWKVLLDVPWDRERVSLNFLEKRAWERYGNRGVPEEDLRLGIEPFLEGAEPRISVEVTLTTFEDLVESELGTCIHEERIMSQRDQAPYRGYIPMNVGFLIEYLFALALSPRTVIDRLPVKLWGRYLSDTISYHIRQLYCLPESDALY